MKNESKKLIFICTRPTDTHIYGMVFAHLSSANNLECHMMPITYIYRNE